MEEQQIHQQAQRSQAAANLHQNAEESSMEGQMLAPPGLSLTARPIQRFQSPSLNMRDGLRAQSPMGQVIQRAEVETLYGTFKDAHYKTIKKGGQSIGVDMALEFHPGEAVNATKIGMVQAIKTYNEGQNTAWHPTGAARIGDSGYRIDQQAPNRNPLYATEFSDPSSKDLSDDPADDRFGEYGKRIPGDPPDVKKAALYDTPQSYYKENSGQLFETTALAVDGKQDGTYYGSVSWGYEIDGAGKFTKLPLRLKSEAVPTDAFADAAEAWNDATARGNTVVDKEPTQVYRSNFSKAFTLAKGTRVDVDTTKNRTFKDELYMDVMVFSGPDTGKTGWVKLHDIKDPGGGEDTLDLPVVAPLYWSPYDDVLDIRPMAQVPRKERVKILDDSDSTVTRVLVLSGEFRNMKGYVNSIGGLPFDNVSR